MSLRMLPRLNGKLFTFHPISGPAIAKTSAGDSPGTAVSALPTDIQPSTTPLSLRLILTQTGNSGR